ncbi:hypothetical protein MACJ_004078 [Theileria orientalis]|uniref:Trafficking protein particle complex subunit n=1 Tax=Theileria orientalis TaxID=68886 RepID=A0A976XIR2_THEOR|nr:hypothetical protein MACJ_004078 [Theileria orientalis]
MTGPNFKVVYISIVGEQNETLFSRSFGDVDESEMQFSVYASMDIIKEQVSQQISGSATSGDPYLGFISPTLIGLNFYKIYAYVAATCFKIIAIINDNEVPPSRIREMFESVHELYSSVICNPLLFNKLDTPKFLDRIDDLILRFS